MPGIRIHRFASIATMCCAILFMAFASTLVTLADDPPPEDIDGDGEDDIVESRPEGSQSNERGEVDIISGSTGELIVTIRGKTDGDKFGYSVAVLKNLNADNNKDLLIGAPHDDDGGRAYAFHGPFTESGPLLITADNAAMTFKSPDPNDFEFGEKVGAVTDLDNDGFSDIRIRAWFLDENDQPVSRTYLVSGSTGNPLYVITGTEPFDPWAEVSGDADRDGDVDQDDFDIVMGSLGLATSYGDLNGDGLVDGLDLALVQASMGTNGFDAVVRRNCPMSIPVNYECKTDCLGVSVILPLNVQPLCEPVRICPGPGCAVGIGPYPNPSLLCVFSSFTYNAVYGVCGSDTIQWSVPCGRVFKSAALFPWMFPIRSLSVGDICVQSTHTCCSGTCIAATSFLSVWIDSDNDGLPDALEVALGLNPFDSDSDSNGISDGNEQSNTGIGMTNLEQLASGTWPGLYDNGQFPTSGMMGPGPVATGPPNCGPSCIDGVYIDEEYVPIPPGQNAIYVCPGSTLRFHRDIYCEIPYPDHPTWFITGANPPGFSGSGGERTSPPIVVPSGGDSGGNNVGAGGAGGESNGECGATFSVGLLTDSNGIPCTSMIQVVPVCVDLAIDSNNDGEINAVDDEIEDNVDLTGKLILVNNIDRDGDGIPGFADGFDYDPVLESDDATLGDRFVPLRLVIPDGFNVTQDRIVFGYSASPPDGIVVTPGPTGPRYTPAPGKLRIWRKDGDESRSKANAADGGDYIAPGTMYIPTDLGLSATGGGAITLWVEAVQSSNEVGDMRISVSIGGCSADAVRLTGFGTRVVSVNQDGSPADEGLLMMSHPTPTIIATEIEMTNVRTTSDNTKVLADLVVSGSIDDALSDLLPGPQGIISTLHLRLNGEPALVFGSQQPVVIPVAYTKATSSGSLLMPYDYSGTFSQVIEGLEIHPGWNTVQLIAQNSRSYSGFAERAFELSPIPPPDVSVDLWMQFYDPDTLAVIIGTDGAASLWPDIYQKIAPGVYQNPFNLESYIHVPADLDHENSESFLARLTHPPFDLSDVLITVTRSDPNQPIFEGSDLLEEHERLDWTGYTFNLEAVTGVDASGGGAFHPFLIEILGPQQLAESILDLSFTSEFENAAGNTVTWERTYDVVELLERRFLALPGNAYPEVMLALPSQTLEDGLVQQHGEWREGAWEFVHGFGQGFADTGIDIVDSVGAVCKLGWHLVKNYNNISVVWRIAHGGGLLTLEDEHRISVAWEVLNVVGTIAWDLYQANAQLAYAVLTGDAAGLNELGEDQRRALQIAVELLDAVREGVAELEIDDYETGRIAGRVVGEVTLAVVTAGAGTVISKSATGVAVINKLATLPFIPAAVKARLLAKGPHYQALATAIGREGEVAASMLRRIEQTDGLSGIEKFKRFLDNTSTPGRQKAVDMAIRLVMSDVMKEIYSEAPSLADIPTVQQLMNLKGSTVYGPRLVNKDLVVHHSTPEYLWRRLVHLENPTWTWQQARDYADSLSSGMPGMLMHQKDHVGIDAEGVASFHRRLANRELPPVSGNAGEVPYTKHEILEGLRDTYDEWWGDGSAWMWAKQWLQQNGIDVSGY